ncbi:MAG: hypothetical protein GY898_30250 [Proteobacteria bacterium]|nr:hypothetical protein [Pseudomonadota bacterium]
MARHAIGGYVARPLADGGIALSYSTVEAADWPTTPTDYHQTAARYELEVTDAAGSAVLGFDALDGYIIVAGERRWTHVVDLAVGADATSTARVVVTRAWCHQNLADPTPVAVWNGTFTWFNQPDIAEEQCGTAEVVDDFEATPLPKWALLTPHDVLLDAGLVAALDTWDDPSGKKSGRGLRTPDTFAEAFDELFADQASPQVRGSGFGHDDVLTDIDFGPAGVRERCAAGLPGLGRWFDVPLVDGFDLEPSQFSVEPASVTITGLADDFAETGEATVVVSRPHATNECLYAVGAAGLGGRSTWLIDFALEVDGTTVFRFTDSPAPTYTDILLHGSGFVPTMANMDHDGVPTAFRSVTENVTITVDAEHRPTVMAAVGDYLDADISDTPSYAKAAEIVERCGGEGAWTNGTVSQPIVLGSGHTIEVPVPCTEVVLGLHAAAQGELADLRQAALDTGIGTRLDVGSLFARCLGTTSGFVACDSADVHLTGLDFERLTLPETGFDGSLRNSGLLAALLAAAAVWLWRPRNRVRARVVAQGAPWGA